MKKTLLLIFTPFVIFSQSLENSEKTYNHEIEWITDFVFESNTLNKQFLNTFLYSGYISNNIKDEWLNAASKNNIVYTAMNNSICYRNLKYNFGLSFSDRNTINGSFSKDIMQLALYGNLNSQDVSFDLSNTNLRADRFQQLKLYYTYNFSKIQLKFGMSYLLGNQHISYIINNGSLYTSPFGTHIDLSYDVDAQVTDTSNLNPFINNGHGVSVDINIDILLEDHIIKFYLEDLGFINWKDNSNILNIDSTFQFQGVHVDNIFNLTDSVLEQYNSDNYMHNYNSGFKSYIPANFGFSILRPLTNTQLKSVAIGVNMKWQPYQDNEPLSFSKIRQGIKESNYLPLIWFSSIYNTKYLDVIPNLSIGGYSNKFNLGLALSKGNKTKFVIGSQHFNDLFSGNEANALSLYFKILKRF